MAQRDVELTRVQRERDSARAEAVAEARSAAAQLAAVERLCDSHRERAERLSAAAATKSEPSGAHATRLRTRAASSASSDESLVSRESLNLALDQVARLRTELDDAQNAQRRLERAARGVESSGVLQLRVDALEQRLAQKDTLLAEQAAELESSAALVRERADNAKLLAAEGGAFGALERLTALRRDNELLHARCLALESDASRALDDARRAAQLASVADERASTAERRAEQLAQQSELALRSAASARKERDGLHVRVVSRARVR